MEVCLNKGDDFRGGNQQQQQYLHYQQSTPMNRINGKDTVDQSDINQTMNQYVRNTLMNRGISLIGKSSNSGDMRQEEREIGKMPMRESYNDTINNAPPLRSPQRDYINHSLIIPNKNANHQQIGYDSPHLFSHNQMQHRSNNNQIRYSNNNNRYAINDFNHNMAYSLKSPLISKASPIPHYNYYSHLNNQYSPHFNINQNQRFPAQCRLNPKKPIDNMDSNFNFVSKSMQHNLPHQNSKTNPEEVQPHNYVDQADLNISYDNFVLDEERRQRQKELYKRDLLAQMKSNERKKAEDKAQKKRDEREAEERIQRENQEILSRLELEKNKSQTQALDNDTMNQCTSIRRRRTTQLERGQREERDEANEKENERRRKQNEEMQIKENALKEFTQKEGKSREDFTDALKQLKEHLTDKNIGLFDKIQALKNEIFTAGSNREEAFRQIENIKKGLQKERIEEGLRKKYVYDVIDEDRVTFFANNKSNRNKKRSNGNNNNEMPEPILDQEDNEEINMIGKSLLINSDKEVDMNVFVYNDRYNEKDDEKSSVKIINSYSNTNDNSSRSSYSNDYMFLSKYFQKQNENEERKAWAITKRNPIKCNHENSGKDNDCGCESYSNVGTIFMNNLDRLNHLKKIENKYDYNIVHNKESEAQFNDFLTKLNNM